MLIESSKGFKQSELNQMPEAAMTLKAFSQCAVIGDI